MPPTPPQQPPVNPNIKEGNVPPGGGSQLPPPPRWRAIHIVVDHGLLHYLPCHSEKFITKLDLNKK